MYMHVHIHMYLHCTFTCTCTLTPPHFTLPLHSQTPTHTLTHPRTTEWVNVASKGLVVVSSSEGRILPYGNLNDIVEREENPKNCHTKDDRNSWFALDLGLWIYPTAYTLRHARGYGSRSSLRNWIFQVSKDGHDWITIRTHSNDTSLGEPG